MLRTDYQDDIFPGGRKYRLINNSDGTITLIDVTEYTQEGDAIGAAELNAIGEEVNGKASSGHTHAWENVTGKPSAFPPSTHHHDERYYTETETEEMLAGKAPSNHTHTWDSVSRKPSTFPAASHTHDDRYFTETEINTKLNGKANSNHTHNYAGSSSAGGAATTALSCTGNAATATNATTHINTFTRHVAIQEAAPAEAYLWAW